MINLVFKFSRTILIVIASLPWMFHISTAEAVDDFQYEVGFWVLSFTEFEGVQRPPRDPDLVLEYELSATRESRLRWSNSRLNLFCERKGMFSYRDNLLMEQVTWVNPQNSPSCAEDVDMQNGTVTSTLAYFYKDRFELHLNLSGKPLIYHWVRKVQKEAAGESSGI